MILYSLPVTEAMTYALLRVPPHKNVPDILGYTENIDDFTRINGVKVLSTNPAKARDTKDGLVVRRTTEFFVPDALQTNLEGEPIISNLLVVLYEDHTGKIIGVSDPDSAGEIEAGEHMVRWEVEEGETAGMLLYATDPEIPPIELTKLEVRSSDYPRAILGMAEQMGRAMMEEEDREWMKMGSKTEEWSPEYSLTAPDRAFLRSIGIEP